MADCEYQIGGQGKFYSESEFKKLLSEGYLDKVMLENQVKVRGIKPNEELAKSFQLPSAIQPAVTTEVKEEVVTPTAEVKTEEVVTPTAVTKTEEKVTEPTAEVETEEKVTEPSVNPQELKLNVKSTTNGLVDVSKQDNDIASIDEVDMSREMPDQYNNNFINKNGELQIKIPAMDFMGRQGGQTLIKLKTPEGFNEQVFAEKLNSIKHEEFKTTSKSVPNVVNQVRQAISESTTQPTTKTTTQTTTETAPETKQPTKEAQVAKSLADALRKAKMNLPKGTAMASFAPGFDEIWDATIETVAKAIEVGGVTVGNFRKSINAGIKALKDTDEYKAITDPKERAELIAKYRESLVSLVPGIYNIDPTEDFGNVWDDSIKIINDSVSKSDKSPQSFQKAIDEGFKNVKKSTWYNALDKEQKQQFAADYNDAMNRMYSIKEGKETVSKETVSKEERAKGKEFKEKVSQATGTAKPEKNITLSESELLRMQIKYGAIAGKKTIQNLQAIKEQIREYAEENLPKDKYSKKEVDSLMRSISSARTEKGLERALDKIDALVGRKLEKQEKLTREQLIKDITDKIKANSKKVIRRDRRTRRKQGKITIPAQRELNQVIQDLKDQGLFNNLESLTTQELSDLNNSLDNIIKTGRAEQKQLTALEQAKIKADKAMILRSLTKGPDDILNGEEEINDTFEKTDGHVIVDGQLMSYSDFKDYVKKNPDADLDNVEFYYNKDASKVREKLEKDTTIRQRIRNTTLWTVSDLETHLAKLGAKAKGLKTWIEGNIAKPIREGRRKSIETVWRETRAYKKKTREIFGNEATMFKALTAPTSVKAKNSEESLSAGQVVHLFNILNNTDPNKREADAKRLMKKNYISAEDVFNFMKKPENYQLLNYANYLAEQYNGPLRNLFGPTIENLHKIDLGSDYYYPQPASKSEAENITDSNNNISLSVTAPNMRHREDNPTSGFELIDAHQMYLSYIDSMSHAKEFIPVVKAINTLISDVNRPYIMEKFGSVSDYSDFIQTLKNTVTNESLYKPGAMTAYLNSVSLSLLWFRIQSVPQQMSSMIHYYHAGIKDGVYPHDVLRAVPTNKKELEFVKDFYADNPYLYNRLGGANIDPEMKKLKEQIDSNANKLVKGTLNFVQFAGLFPIKFGDATAAASIGGGMSFALAQYKQAFKETGDAEYAKEHAIQRWYEETERTGQVSTAREIMSTKSFDNVVRLFIPFSSAQQGVVKKIYKAYLNTKDWKNLDAKEKAQTVSDLIYFSVFAPLPFLMSGAIGYAFVSMLSDDDEDEKEMTRLLYDLGTDAAQSHLTALGLPGLILNTATNFARDKSHFNESPAYTRKEDIAVQLFKMLNNNKTWDDLTPAEKKEFIKNYKGERFGSFENTYNESSMWDRATRKDIDELLESIGILNLSKLYDRIETLSKDGKITAFALGVDRARTEMNKKLDPYFNKAVESGKKDALFEFLARAWRDATGEAVDTKYIPQGAEKPKKSRGGSSSDPFKFKKGGPSPFKKAF